MRVVVVVTSDKSYRNRGLDRGYTETDELGGIDPYSASKAGAELRHRVVPVLLLRDGTAGTPDGGRVRPREGT